MQKMLGVYLSRIQDAIQKIHIYTDKISREEFEQNTMIQDACLMQLQHIGETIVQIDKHFGDKVLIADKKEIIGFRNLVSHQYKAVRIGFIWNIIQQKIPVLETSIKTLTSSDQ